MKTEPGNTSHADQRRELVESLLKQEGIGISERIPRNIRQGDAPLSLAQERIWFLEHLDPGTSAYSMVIVLRLFGWLDVPALEGALGSIVARHESLRATFHAAHGKPVQVIGDDCPLLIEFEDLREPGHSDAEAKLQRLVSSDVRRPFDLERGPLMRVKLFRLAEEEHVLLLTMHHIAGDAWSMGVLVREMAQLYGAFHSDDIAPLPELPIQYADYAQWQREWLEGPRLQGEVAYWTKQLGGELPILELPADRPRPATQTFNGAHLQVSLPKHLLDGLKEFSKRERVTLFMTLLAAFQTLLMRYTDQEDVIVGTPVAGRNRLETETLIGLFINTLVMRTDLSGNPTFRDLLSRVRNVVLTAFEHQNLPFGKLVAELQPERDLSHPPVFQVMFVLQNAPTLAVCLPGLVLAPVNFDNGVSKLDLTLESMETDDGLTCCFEYNTDLFEFATIERMAIGFRAILEGLLENPERRIWGFSLLGPAECRTLTHNWNETRAEYPDVPVYRLIEERAMQVPDQVALVFEGQQLTYAELNRSANQLAHYLRGRGVQPGSLVGICVERSLEMVIGLLGIMKAGAAYAPFDPGFPQERLAFMIEDSQVPLVLTQEHLARVLQESATQVVCLDRDWKEIAGCAGENSTEGATLEDLAYVIYTSGSTGKPKGVQISHRAVVNFLTSMRRDPGMVQEDVLVAVTTLSFDIAGLELYLPLMVGARIVIASRETTLDATKLGHLLLSCGATVMQATPAMWRMLIEAGWEGIPHLKILCGGEALTRDLADQLLPRSASLWNMYGPTETTIWSAVRKITSEKGPVVIGRPIANTQMYVLDRYLNLVPIGVPGELHIGGVGLARGYWNRPQLTAEKFIADPFRPAPSAQLYKTGDLVRHLPDGTLEFLGRIDHQVKIRGFRIELGEIEAVLSTHPAVRECAVVAREDNPGNIQLVAYFVSDDSLLTPYHLRKYLRKRLPDYMAPAAIVRLQTIPRTANGKLDRRALPVPDFGGHSVNNSAAPRTPTEDVISAIWMDLLKIKQIGIHDNFFELGGHSLLAMQITSRIAQTFKVAVSVRSIFDSPTVADLSHAVNAIREAGDGIPCDSIKALRHDSVLPLSFAQQRLWFLHQMEPSLSSYILPLALRLCGDLQVDALKSSLREVVSRHAALRTRFTTIDGTPMQCTETEHSLEVSVLDLSGSSEAVRESEAFQLAVDDARRPFDLVEGPPIRASVLRMSERDHILLISMHHISSDDWSIGIFLRDLTALYEAFCAGEPSPLPPLAIQYADFSQWQRDWLKGEVLEKKLAYWKEMLAGPLPVLDLPTDRPRPAVQSFRGSRESFLLAAPVVASLKSLSLAESATLFMALLTSLQCLLYRYSGQKDIIVGSPVAGRGRVESEDLIGFFVNTLPLRCDLSGDPSFRELLNRVREITLGAYAHQDLPFEILVDAVQPQRDLSRTPVYQVMLAPQSNSLRDLKLRNVQVTALEIEPGISKFDLTFYVSEDRGEVHGRVEYNTDLWDSATITHLIAHFQRLLEAAIGNPDLRISQLPMLTEEEHRRMVREWNDTRSDHAKQLCVAQLFEAQAGENPDQLAVASPSAQLTYRELNEKANQLAHYLKERGVGPEVLVGVCMQRSVEMVIGLLAVLKAGGAYVPLDPAYPSERLAFMLEDAGAPVLLTQRELLQKMPETAAEVVCLDQEEDQIADQSADNLAPMVEANNLAYVIYTSGSTGKPKGVAIEHRGLLNLIHWHQRTYEVNEKDRATLLAAQAFDASVWELWPYLTAGASIHIPDEETRSSPAALMQWLAEERITLTFLATPLAEAALEVDPPKNLCLKAMLTGGDRLHRAPERKLPFRLMNHYGPTENTVVATYCEVLANEEGVPTIGRPISNTQSYVLDQGMQPVPVGVAGELYIGGESLARGYHQRPELTAEKFVANPFSSLAEARLYKTGDLVRYRADGALEFLGRMDDQVKIRGFRIELGEIESLLATHHLIRDCVVVAREETPGQKRLVAYVAVDRERSPSQEELCLFLSRKLPSYMVPPRFVTLDALPLTAHGKVDRDALPEADIADSPTRAYVKPRTPVEEVLVEIWTQVLKRPQIGIHDNFFEHGGDSIISIQVTAKANQHGLQISPKQIFQQQTIAELAAVATRLPVWTEERDEVTGPAPLTPIQRWFFEQEFANPDHFNQAILLELHRRLDPSILQQAVHHWILRHDALRHRFVKADGRWQQFNTDAEAETPISFHDLSGIPHPERPRAIERVATDLQQGLSLSNGPLLRVAFFNMGADEPGRLLVTIHHLVVDGVSWRILLDDFVNVIEASSEGKEFKPPPKGISFKKWAEHLLKLAREEALAHERGYWTQTSSRSFAALPVDYSSNSPNTERSVFVIRVQLDAVETRKLLEEAPAAHRVTVNELLLTALAKTLYEWTGSTSLLIDMEGHGREEISPGFDGSRTVGWFTTIFPVVLDQSNGSLSEVLRRVKEQVRSIPNHGLGYGVLRYLSNDATRRHLESLPRAQLLFNYLGQFDRPWRSPWLSAAPESAGPLRSPGNHRPYLIEVSGAVHEGRLLMEWSYSEHLHRRETVEALGQNFLSFLRALITRSEQPEVSSVSPADFSAARISQEDFSKLFARISRPAQGRAQ